jgi:chemotaxis protein histidine kinase CheA
MTTPTPGQPLGMSDFFALEAGEYLERLDALVQPEALGQGADELVRLARALRGAALMGNQPSIARAASGLETLARAVREGRRPWDQNIRQIAIRAVDDLKIFVRRAPTWTEADTAKADALGGQLEQLAGRPSTPVRAVEPPGLDAGARAFVAREGAAIAGALERAGQALRANPLAHDPLQHVLKALQPLRGLAALNDLPPLPDLLEGIERVIADLARATSPAPEHAGELFSAAGAAIAQAAREVAERGRPDAEAAAFRTFATQLMRFLESDADVMPITTLYHDDAGPHMVRRGTPAPRPATLGRVELVSHGDHLRQAADSIERAPSTTQRELRAHTLAGTFRALEDAGSGTLAEAVGRFAQRARDAVAKGAAVRDPAAFAAELRRAGDLLAQSASGDEAALAGRLDQITAALAGMSGAAAPAPAAHEPPIVPIQSLAPAPAAPTHHAPRPEPPAPRTTSPAQRAATPADVEEVAETQDLTGSWVTYHRMVAAGVGPASLEALLAGATRVPPPPPSRDTAGPPPPRAPLSAAAELPMVDVRTLLYRGDRALARAQELRRAAKGASGDELRALVEEVCDLVELALEPTAPGA